MPLVFSIVKTREERYQLFVADVLRAIAKYKAVVNTNQRILDYHYDLLAEASTNFDDIERRAADHAHCSIHETVGSAFDPITYSLHV